MKDATIFLFLQTRILTLIAGVVVLLFLLRLGNSFADPAHTSRALLAGFFSVLRTHVMLLLYAAVVAHDASQGSIPESLNLSNIFILFHLRDFHLLLSLFFRLRYWYSSRQTLPRILISWFLLGVAIHRLLAGAFRFGTRDPKTRSSFWISSLFSTFARFISCYFFFRWLHSDIRLLPSCSFTFYHFHSHRRTASAHMKEQHSLEAKYCAPESLSTIHNGCLLDNFLGNMLFLHWTYECYIFIQF